MHDRRKEVLRIFAIVMLLLLSAAAARAQSPEEIRDANYQKFFTMAGAVFEKLPKICKTKACAKLSEDGAKLIAEGRDKHARGVLVAEERAVWHGKVESTLLASIHELQDGIYRKHGGVSALPRASLNPPVCLKSVQGPGGDQCQLCYDVLEQAVEICALDAFVSPDAALICIAWATILFGGCINRYCDPSFNTN